MYLSFTRIRLAVGRLQRLHPFFGTAFPTLKQAEIPIGTPQKFHFVEQVDAFLKTYYQPTSQSQNYFSPFQPIGLSQRWNDEKYALTLQNMTRKSFSDALISDHSGQKWAWQSGYIEALKTHLSETLIPALELAIWLFWKKDWGENSQLSYILETFFQEFHITDEERALFDTSIPPEMPGDPNFHDVPVPPKYLWTWFGYSYQDVSETEEGRLYFLKLIGVGPTKAMEFNPAPRLNIITGDNGLGKTFLLECAWWALTGTWAQDVADPREDAPSGSPRIAYQLEKEGQPYGGGATIYQWKWDSLGWPFRQVTEQTVLSGLALFAEADGSFSIWDRAKQLPTDTLTGSITHPMSINLSPAEVRNGKEESGLVLSNGILRDWIRWQTAPEGSPEKARFKDFTRALTRLSPHPDEQLVPGEPTRWSVLDAREMPTLRFSYGDVPFIHCSAGIQRIVALAYMLVWAWHEHLEASKATHRDPQRSIVLLIDEMEAHLHPFWQRTIVPALMDVVQALAKEVKTQLLIATHSPLVLASVETRWDEKQDKLFHLDLEDGEVRLHEAPFIKRGTADLWLMSHVFGLKQPRSKEAEEVIERASELQQQARPSMKKIEEVSQELVRVLAQDDEFWPRWVYFAEKRGVKV